MRLEPRSVNMSVATAWRSSVLDNDDYDDTIYEIMTAIGVRAKPEVRLRVR